MNGETDTSNNENSLSVNKESSPNNNTQNDKISAPQVVLPSFDEYMAEGKGFVAKDNEKALQMFRNALNVAGTDTDKVIQAKLLIAKMQLEMKNYMDVENTYREILKNKLNNIDEEAALEGLIRTKNAAGDANIAVDIISLDYHFKTPGLVLALAEAYVNLGKVPQASYLLEKQSQLLNTIFDASLKSELDLLHEKISMELKEENRKNYSEYIKKAHYAEDIKDFKDALQYYERAFKLFKDEPLATIEARLGMAKMHFALGEYSISKKIYTELLKEKLKKIERVVAEEGLKFIKNEKNVTAENKDLNKGKDINKARVSKPAEIAENKAGSENIYTQCIDPCLLKAVEEKVLQKDYRKAVLLLDKATKKDPCNIYLWLKEIDLYQESEQYKNALHTLNLTDWHFPCNLETVESRKNVEEKLCKLPHNRIGAYYDWQYVSDLQQYWQFTTYSYYRVENYIQYGFAYNKASRFGLKGDQAEIDISINPLRGLRGDFSFAYASRKQFLWPNRLFYGELYYALLNGFEFSFGQENRRYLTFHNQKIIRTTGSIGQYFGKYLLHCRLNRYNFLGTALGRISLTRFFGDNDFISIEVLGGNSPDIADLPPLDKMVLLQQKGYSLSGQIELFPNFLVRAGVGFYVQYYPFSNLHRRITDNYVNVTWKF